MIRAQSVPEGVLLTGDAVRVNVHLTEAHLAALTQLAASHGWAAGGQTTGLTPGESDAIALAAVAAVLNLLAEWSPRDIEESSERTEKP